MHTYINTCVKHLWTGKSALKIDETEITFLIHLNLAPTFSSQSVVPKKPLKRQFILQQGLKIPKCEAIN